MADSSKKRFATSVLQLAGILRRSPTTLSAWKHAGCPCSEADKDAKGRYSVAAVRKWMESQGHGDGPNVSQGGGKPVNGGKFGSVGDLTKARAEEKQARAGIAVLELRRLEGELLSKSAVEQHDRRRHEYMIDVLHQWAASLGPALAGKTALQITREMKRRVDQLMREFAGESDGG